MVKRVVLFLFFATAVLFSKAQCSTFAFAPEKWSISPEGGAGAVLLTDLGKGWEFNYGIGLEWAPFKRLVYFNLNGRHVHQYINDDTPDADIFADRPDRIEMYATLFRLQFGLKLRLDWWFNKVDYEGIHPFVGLSYMHDEVINEETKLIYAGSSTNSNSIYSERKLGGEQYELGFSWVINDNLKWDLSGYIYDQREYESIISNGFSYIPDSKLGVGLSTGLYITF